MVVVIVLLGTIKVSLPFLGGGGEGGGPWGMVISSLRTVHYLFETMTFEQPGGYVAHAVPKAHQLCLTEITRDLRIQPYSLNPGTEKQM